MSISRARLDEYSAALSRLSGMAQSEVRAAFEIFQGLGFADALDEVIAAAVAASSYYGDMAATLAAELYEELALDEAGLALTATLADSTAREALDVDIGYAAKNHLFVENPDTAAFRSFVDGVMDKAVRNPARRTITENATRDHGTGVRYARVPKGPACAFCIMLASQGFVYASADTAGELNQYHSRCHCEIVPSWEESPRVEDYDWRGMRQRYYKCRKEAGSAKPEDILDVMRKQDEQWLYDGTGEFTPVEK